MLRRLLKKTGQERIQKKIEKDFKDRIIGAMISKMGINKAFAN